ncbi:MAG: MOSC domain-containing protein [Patulibacter minatonensis]
MGVVRTVNVGERKVIGERRGRPWRSGIDKRPVDGRRAIGDDAVAGDTVVDLTVHGGAEKAVYAYAFEDTAWWSEQMGRELWEGAFGENLTFEGLSCTESVIGSRLRVGTALLEVSQPRLPCATLAKFHGDPKLVKRFALARRPGMYFRIVEPGDVGAGDRAELVDEPTHGVTIALVYEVLLHDHALAARVLEAPELSHEVAEPLRERFG